MFVILRYYDNPTIFPEYLILFSGRENSRISLWWKSTRSYSDLPVTIFAQQVTTLLSYPWILIILWGKSHLRFSESALMLLMTIGCQSSVLLNLVTQIRELHKLLSQGSNVCLSPSIRGVYKLTVRLIPSSLAGRKVLVFLTFKYGDTSVW